MDLPVPPEVYRAVEKYGFIDGKYGDTPFQIHKSWQMTNTTGTDMTNYEIVMHDRSCGCVEVYKGQAEPVVRIDLAQWLRGRHNYISNVDMAEAESRIIAWYAVADAEATHRLEVALTKNRS